MGFRTYGAWLDLRRSVCWAGGVKGKVGCGERVWFVVIEFPGDSVFCTRSCVVFLDSNVVQSFWRRLLET
jgi:hypothetical protein